MQTESVRFLTFCVLFWSWHVCVLECIVHTESVRFLIVLFCFVVGMFVCVWECVVQTESIIFLMLFGVFSLVMLCFGICCAKGISPFSNMLCFAWLQ